MKRSEKVEELIRKHLILTTGLGLIPLPLLDIAAVTTSQVMMIRKMCDFYDIDFDDDSTKTILTSLTGSVLAKIGASIMKTIPIVGTFIGGASMAALSGASTYAVGHVFKKHFDEGGDLKSFDINAWKKYYEEMFEKGKTEAVKVKLYTGICSIKS